MPTPIKLYVNANANGSESQYGDAGGVDVGAAAQTVGGGAGTPTFASVTTAALTATGLVTLANHVVVLTGAGAPVDGTTGDNVAGPGSLYIDITGANAYIQTGLITNPVWKLITRAA